MSNLGELRAKTTVSLSPNIFRFQHVIWIISVYIFHFAMTLSVLNIDWCGVFSSGRFRLWTLSPNSIESNIRCVRCLPKCDFSIKVCQQNCSILVCYVCVCVIFVWPKPLLVASGMHHIVIYNYRSCLGASTFLASSFYNLRNEQPTAKQCHFKFY